jgi:hypothetical protein
MVEELNLRNISCPGFDLVRELMSGLRPKYRWTSIAAACTAIVFLLVVPHGVASAQSQSPRWSTFVGWKFGTTIAYPASGFSALPEPDAHDGRTFVSPDGARIAVFASYNALDETVDTELASLLKSERYAGVTYKTRGPNWFVLSGLRTVDGHEQVFYEKYLFSPGNKKTHAVVVTYPVELKTVYDPLVGRIGSSLRGS